MISNDWVEGWHVCGHGENQGQNPSPMTHIDVYWVIILL